MTARDKGSFRNLDPASNAPETGDTSPQDLTNGGEEPSTPETESQAAESEPQFHVTVSGEGGPYYLAGRTPFGRAKLVTDKTAALTFSEEEAGKHAEGLRQPQDWTVDVIPATD